MAFQTINLGTYANDGTGDDLRTAFTKVNDNFSLFSGEVTDGANLGAGTGIFANKTANLDFGNTLNFKSIVGGNNLTVIHDGTTITLAVNNPLVGNVTGNLTGNVTGNVSGNAGTVTNGVYTTGAYANPSWITSLAKSKVGLSNVENTALSTWNGSTNITTVGVLASLSVATTINSDLRGNVTGNVIGNVSGNAGTVTNGVYTTSSINALIDVDTVSVAPTNGQALVWNSGSSRWVPGSVASGGGGGGGNLDFGTFSAPSGFTLDLGTF